jgi:glycosyltransferase involved in cell wall biosynthesis
MSGAGPAVSVVLPLYNRANTIPRALDSILRQTSPDFEIIVVDDGSTDQGPEIVKRMTDPRIRLIRQPNRGVSAARNRGIAEARAPMIALLDADDAWRPEFLEAMLGLAERLPGAGMYVSGMCIHCVDGSAWDVFAVVPGGQTAGLIEDYFAAPEEGTFAGSSSIMLPKQVLDEVGGFPEGEPMGEDQDLWARIALKHPAACDTRVLADLWLDQGQREQRRLRLKAPYPPWTVSRWGTSTGWCIWKRSHMQTNCFARSGFTWRDTGWRRGPCGHSSGCCRRVWRGHCAGSQRAHWRACGGCFSATHRCDWADWSARGR